MAKADRRLTIQEVFAGYVTEEYLDWKEQYLIKRRHCARLSEQLQDIEDKMEICGSREDLAQKYQKIENKMYRLQNEINQMVNDIPR